MKRWRLLVCVAISAVCLIGFIELAEDFAYSPVVASFDRQVSVAIWSLRGPALSVIMTGVTASAGVLSISVATAAVAVVLLRRGQRRSALMAVLLVSVGVLLSTVAKGRFERSRPPAATALVDLPSSYSFPSGHSMASLCLSAAISVLALRSGLSTGIKAAIVAACAAWALVVGFSRVYLGVHYPSDVLASWLLGGAWIAIVVGAEWDRHGSGAGSS